MISLSRFVRAATPEPGTDRDLLDRYARDRDEEAFAALVRRYGPGIWAACQRLADGDAEDAFQAVFLTLARKAGSVTGPLPAWLHGVARRVAANLRRGARRRSVAERATARPAETSPEDIGLREGLALLDEELARLPERYRAVLIVCCLEGRSRDEASAHLGWSDGQVKGRLERAREVLRARLRRRGVELGALLLAATVSRPAPAVASTNVLAAGTSPVALSLANGVMRTMFVQKLRVGAAAVLLVAAVSGAIVAQNLKPGAAEPPEGKKPEGGPEPAVKAGKPTPKKDEGEMQGGAKAAPAEFDPVVSLKRLVARSEGKSLEWTHQAEDGKWYRVRLTARTVTFRDVKRTDSLVTPFRGEITWQGETAFSKPFATEDEASKAAPDAAVVKDEGSWDGAFESRDGRWQLIEAKFGTGPRTPGQPVPATPMSPARRSPNYWSRIFNDEAAKMTEDAPAGEFPAWGQAVKGLRLGVVVSSPKRAVVVIENAGKDATVLNLGIVLANGKTQLPTAIRLNVTDPTGKTHTCALPELGIAGRVDPFVVPLPAGARYTLPLALDAYTARLGSLAEGRYRVTAEYVGEKVTQTNADTTGLALMPYWTGTARSGEGRFAVPFKPAKGVPTEIDGAWQFVSQESGGRSRSINSRWAVAGGAIAETERLWMKGDAAIEEWTFRVDPTKSPKEIDLIPGEGPLTGKVLKGIYTLEKGVLTICLPSPTGDEPEKQPRPSDFRTRNKEVVVLSLRRERP